MRKCAIHGNELNCRNVVLGECSGILVGVEAEDAPRYIPTADLGDDVEYLDDPEREIRYEDEQPGRRPTRAEAKAQLMERGIPESIANEMLDAPGSPFADGNAR